MSCYTIQVRLVGYTLLRRREIWEAKVWNDRIVGGAIDGFTGSSYSDALDRAKRWCDWHDDNYVQPPPSMVDYTPQRASTP